MADKVWTAAELEALTPADQNELLNSSLIRDPANVPSDFLERVRQRIADAETQDR